MALCQAPFFLVSNRPTAENVPRNAQLSVLGKNSSAPVSKAIPSTLRRSLQCPRAVITDILPGNEKDGEEETSDAAKLGVAAHSAHSAPALGQHSCSQNIMDAEARLFVRTYNRFPVAFVKGQGCYLFDAEGKQYLDMAAGIAVNALGHGDQSWVNAVAEQASTLSHVSNVYYSEPQVRLAKRLVDSSFSDRVFFCNSGTEAIEAALKFSRKYQRCKVEAASNSQGKDHPATDFVAFTNSFHGRTIGALALTSKMAYRAPFEPIMPGVQFVEFGDSQAAEAAIAKGKTAAVFVEPVQGEGGIHTAAASFLRSLRNCCDKSGALLVFDEVQCGLGRTGYLWAHEACGVQPDMLTVAKPLAGGLPIGAVLVTERVASAIEYGDHGSTFAGGPLICHAALAVLNRIQEPGFLEHVTAKGHLLQSLLRERLGNNPHVKEVRGTGLLVGVELDVPATPLVKAALQKGLLVLTAGNGNVVRFVPPLVISEQEILQGVDILTQCMSALE